MGSERVLKALGILDNWQLSISTAMSLKQIKLKASCFSTRAYHSEKWARGKLSRHFHYFGMWHITDSNGVSDPGPTAADSLTARDSAL